MPLTECPRCTKAFNAERMNMLCPECLAQENKDLQEVVEYLRKFPMANAIEVTERTSVSVAQLMRFVKAGALRLMPPVADLKCRLCGAEIKKGTLCGDCREKVEELHRDAKKKTKKKK